MGSVFGIPLAWVAMTVIGTGTVITGATSSLIGVWPYTGETSAWWMAPTIGSSALSSFQWAPPSNSWLITLGL